MIVTSLNFLNRIGDRLQAASLTLISAHRILEACSLKPVAFEYHTDARHPDNKLEK
jgi:hypothetical protein